MSKRFLLILAGIAVLFIGLVVFTKKDSKTNGSNNQTATTSNHVKGAGTSNVTLLEYGDFQCPGCGAYYPLVKQIKDKYGDKITFQFRNFPLVSKHPNAMAAHRAAEAASVQNKFWEMHDMLYERQDQWNESRSPSSLFRGFAQELGLDLARYDSDVSSSTVQGIINADIDAGQAIGVSGTPSFVLDGKLIDINNNPRNLDDFSKLIDDAISAKAAQ